jgi:hypothetical protein
VPCGGEGGLAGEDPAGVSPKKAKALSAIREEIPSPVCCQKALAVPQFDLSNKRICSSIQSTPAEGPATEEGVSFVGWAVAPGREASDGQTTNSTILDNMEGV